MAFPGQESRIASFVSKAATKIFLTDPRPVAPSAGAALEAAPAAGTSALRPAFQGGAARPHSAAAAVEVVAADWALVRVGVDLASNWNVLYRTSAVLARGPAHQALAAVVHRAAGSVPAGAAPVQASAEAEEVPVRT
jgi:hypothetical protein